MNSGADDRGHLGERMPVSSPIQRLESHPLREELYEEVHERPSPMLRAPMRASHMVFLTDEHSQEEAFDHVCRLARRYSANLPNAHSTSYYQDLGGFEIRWEKHTEFSSYTFLRRGITDPPFSENALAVLPVDWLEATPGLMIAAAHCVISDAPAPDPFGPELADWFEGQTLFGSRIVNPAADLDEQTLRAVAASTGGNYYRARDTAGLVEIYGEIDTLERVVRLLPPRIRHTDRPEPLIALAGAFLICEIATARVLRRRIP